MTLSETAPVISRKLGISENFFRSRTSVDFYRNFFTVATYTRPLIDDKPLLFRALRKCVLDYHILVCNVFKNSTAGYCEVLPLHNVTFGDLVEFHVHLSQPSGVSEKLMAELGETKYFELYVQKPLIKLVVTGNYDLAAVFEHTLADGVVARLFHEILLDALAYCDSPSNDLEYSRLYGTAPSAVDADTVVFNLKADSGRLRNSLPPPAEMIMQDPVFPYCDNDPEHYSKKIPPGFSKWPGFAPSTREYKVAYKLVNIPSLELSRILARCREEKVSLTSYVSHVQALALQPVFGDYYTLMSISLTLRWFLSEQKVERRYRPLLGKKLYRMLGNFAHMGVPELMEPVYAFSWDKTRSIHANLQQSIKNDKVLSLQKNFFDNAHPLEDNESFFTLQLNKRKGDSVKLSNLGYADFPVHRIEGKEAWSIKDVVFAQHLAPAASEFVINMISSPVGGLNIVLSFYELGHDLSKYVKDFRQQLMVNCA